MIVEHDRLGGKVAEEVAAVEYVDRHESVLRPRRRAERPSGEARQQLHPGADPEHGPVRREDSLSEPVELALVATRPWSARAGEDDRARSRQPRRVDVLVVRHDDGVARRVRKPLAQAFVVPRAGLGEVTPALGVDDLDRHLARA